MISLPEMLREYQVLRAQRERGALEADGLARLEALEAWLSQHQPPGASSPHPGEGASAFATDIPDLSEMPFADEDAVVEVAEVRWDPDETWEGPPLQVPFRPDDTGEVERFVEAGLEEAPGDPPAGPAPVAAVPTLQVAEADPAEGAAEPALEIALEPEAPEEPLELTNRSADFLALAAEANGPEQAPQADALDLELEPDPDSELILTQRSADFLDLAAQANPVPPAREIEPPVAEPPAEDPFAGLEVDQATEDAFLSLQVDGSGPPVPPAAEVAALGRTSEPGSLAAPEAEAVEDLSIEEAPEAESVEDLSIEEAPEAEAVEDLSIEEAPEAGAVEDLPIEEAPEAEADEDLSIEKAPEAGAVEDLPIEEAPEAEADEDFDILADLPGEALPEPSPGPPPPLADLPPPAPLAPTRGSTPPAPIPDAPAPAPSAPAPAPSAPAPAPSAPSPAPSAPAPAPSAPAPAPSAPAPAPSAPAPAPSAPAPTPGASAAAATESLRVSGVHRVVVHLTRGQPLRGRVEDLDLAADTLPVLPLVGDGLPQPIATEQVRAVFFLLGPGQAPRKVSGPQVEVRFGPGRDLRGTALPAQPGAPGIFVVPADAARSNVQRIFAYAGRVPLRWLT